MPPVWERAVGLLGIVASSSSVLWTCRWMRRPTLVLSCNSSNSAIPVCLVVVQMNNFCHPIRVHLPSGDCQPQARKITHLRALAQGVEIGQIKAEKVCPIHHVSRGDSTSASVSDVVVMDGFPSTSSYF